MHGGGTCLPTGPLKHDLCAHDSTPEGVRTAVRPWGLHLSVGLAVFQQLITFVLQLKADAVCDSTLLRQRDRAIGQSLIALRQADRAASPGCSKWLAMIRVRWRSRSPTLDV